MENVGRLHKDGTFAIAGEINELVPAVVDGLTKFYTLEELLVTGRASTSIMLRYVPDTDTIPEIPDSATGLVYKQDAWTSIDWTAIRCTVDNATKPGTLIVTATDLNPALVRTTAGADSSIIRVKITKVRGTATAARFADTNSGAWGTTVSYDGAASKTFDLPSGPTFTTIYPGFTGSAIGDVYEISFIYVGTGVYASQIPDLSGNFRVSLTTQDIILV